MQAAIDRLNLEGYANLEQWVAELDRRIEGILLQRLVQIVQVWCGEFDRAAEEGDTGGRAALRDITNKRRGDKRAKEEKVSADRQSVIVTDSGTVLGGKHDAEAGCARDSDTESSHLPGPADRICARELDTTAARLAGGRVPAAADPEFAV